MRNYKKGDQGFREIKLVVKAEVSKKELYNKLKQENEHEQKIKIQELTKQNNKYTKKLEIRNENKKRKIVCY